MDVTNRIKIERRIARKIVGDALAAGCLLSVFDCEEWTVIRSTDKAEIMAALFTTDDDKLLFRTADGKKIGWVWLVYGNDGYDVICDYTANPETEALLAGALALSEKIETEVS